MESNGENSLTPRQLKFIPFFLSCPSIEEACRKAHVSKPTVYGWLKEEGFSGEVRKQKDLIYSRAIDSLAAGVNNAVAKLMKLLNSRNEAIALRAAQTILSLVIKTKEADASQREEQHKSGAVLFSLENVAAAWSLDEEKNTDKRKSEVSDQSI